MVGGCATRAPSFSARPTSRSGRTSAPPRPPAAGAPSAARPTTPTCWTATPAVRAPAPRSPSPRPWRGGRRHRDRRLHRLPAGANGVVGIKPTLGLVSRSGMVPDLGAAGHRRPDHPQRHRCRRRARRARRHRCRGLRPPQMPPGAADRDYTTFLASTPSMALGSGSGARATSASDLPWTPSWRDARACKGSARRWWTPPTWSSTAWARRRTRPSCVSSSRRSHLPAHVLGPGSARRCTVSSTSTSRTQSRRCGTSARRSSFSPRRPADR